MGISRLGTYMSEMYTWVKNIIIFLILTTIISNLLGKSTYKKYIELITGIILLILVITPFFKLFNLTDSLDYYFNANYLLSEAKDISHEIINAEVGQVETIIKQYQDSIDEQVETVLMKEKLYINEIEITIDEDSSSNTFGQIKGLDIIAGYVKNNSEVETEKVEKIQISKIKIGEKEKADDRGEEDFLSPTEINAKKMLSDFYNMNTDNINISIQE